MLCTSVGWVGLKTVIAQAHNQREDTKHGTCFIMLVKNNWESGTFNQIFDTDTNRDYKSYIKLSFCCCPNQLCEHIIFGIGKILKSRAT